ncbi:PAS domain-containing protein [candidate division KSB1 bacterium]|nr:MAG: PAS domain-containing protein [candidate division KSB1 bacterium]
MSDCSNVAELIEKLKQVDLPVGYYVVEKDGRFLYANKLLLDLLHLKADNYLQASIADKYANPEERKTFVDIVLGAAARNQQPPKQVISFTVEGREIFVQDHCWPIYNPPESQKLVGFVGSLVDVTEEERYRRKLPVGVYRVNPEGMVVYVNQAMVKMLKYGSPEDIVDKKSVGELYFNPEKEKEFSDLLKEKGEVVDKKVELVKSDGQTIWVSASAYPLGDPKVDWVSREGVLVNVTVEELYRQIMEYVPVGLYRVLKKDGKNILHDCNRQFDEMFGFAPGTANGQRAEIVHVSPEDTVKYEKAIRDADLLGQPLVGYVLRTKKQDGTIIFIEANTRAIHKRGESGTEKGEIIGRIGALRDITNEVALREQVKEFTEDFGAVLHEYSSALLMLRESTDSALESLGQDPFPKVGEITPRVADQSLSEPVSKFIDSLIRLRSQMSVNRQPANLTPEEFEDLDNYQVLLKNPEKYIPEPALRLPAIRDAVKNILNLLDKFESSSQYQEQIKDVKRNAEEVLRICSLIYMHKAGNAILSLGKQVRAVRNFVTFHIREDRRDMHFVSKLIDQAVSEWADFAHIRNVEIKLDYIHPNVILNVSKDDVVRAMANLLHNAIKYSWERKQGVPPWVDIRTRVVQKWVHIEFEDWGVPIPADEIKNDVLFRIGVRGRLSSDRERGGTGVGLADARRVAQRYGGDVTIVSRPADSKGKPDNYKQPFLTTVTLRLPIFSN